MEIYNFPLILFHFCFRCMFKTQFSLKMAGSSRWNPILEAWQWMCQERHCRHIHDYRWEFPLVSYFSDMLQTWVSYNLSTWDPWFWWSRLHRQIPVYFFLLLKSFLSNILHVLNLTTSYQSIAKFRNRAREWLKIKDFSFSWLWAYCTFSYTKWLCLPKLF